MFRDGVARLLVFRVGAERFGVSLALVDEVVDAPAVQRLPDSSRFVLGISMLRDSLVTVYDPRPILNVNGSVDGGGAALVFLRGDRRVALAIDDVFDVIVIEENEVRPAPGAGAADGILIGVVRRGSDLIAVLDADALLAAATIGAEATAMSEGESV
jgi:purine-binding chemotaxis protein CheW